MKTLPQYAQMTERALQSVLPERAQGGVPKLLNASMRYSLLAGGKRLRPAMLLGAVELLGGDAERALAPACAVEMIHTYSLIHDDLPGMDDDSLRRGLATNHVVYGVGQAILAGDGLLTGAFELLLRDALEHPETLMERVRAAGEIARGAGVSGMVAGQCLDLDCERGRKGGEDELLYIHEKKTASMFICPLRAGARLMAADARAVDALTRYGRAFGLMFQAADDLLDAEGDRAQLGKSVGKDEAEGKLTAVSVYGAEATRGRVDQLLQEGISALAPFGGRADFFRELILAMRGRSA